MEKDGTTIEELFRRFRTTRDGEAFAIIFRTTLLPLTRLAANMRIENGSIDDVLQTTYMVAIDKSADFDITRPILPWLAGILLREVRRRRYADLRQPDPTRLQRTFPAGVSDRIAMAPTR